MDGSNSARSVIRLADESSSPRWSDCLGATGPDRSSSARLLIGVLPGEGIGPEVVGGALEVLQSVAKASNLQIDIREGGAIGKHAERRCGVALSAEVFQFCKQIFADGGAILNGPGGGRYVYELRKQFDLFFKISPLRVINGLPEASRLKASALRSVDILVARENTGGVYQELGAADITVRPMRGQPRSGDRASLSPVYEHRFGYSEYQVQRFLRAAARLARSRSGVMTVVWKESGVPSISALWRRCAEAAARHYDIRFAMVDIDLMAYRLIHESAAFDVIAAPNLCGDVLADLGATLLGSRGLSYSGNWSERGEAVYQTNHGAAYDLAGKDRANPCAQIFSLAMMLRESFGLWRQAEAIEDAVRAVWSEGWRTEDVATPGLRVIGTREMSSRIAAKAGEIACRAQLAA